MAITVSGVLRRDTRHTVRGWLSHWPVNTSPPIYMTNPPQTDTPRTDGVKFAVSIFEHGKFIRHQTVTIVEHAETLERELNQVRLNFAKEVDRGQAFINRIKEENRQLTTRTEQAEAELNQVIETCNKCEAECLGYATASQQAESKLAEVEREMEELKQSEYQMLLARLIIKNHELNTDNDQLFADMKVAVKALIADKKLLEEYFPSQTKGEADCCEGSPCDLTTKALSTPSAKRILSSLQPHNP